VAELGHPVEDRLQHVPALDLEAEVVQVGAVAAAQADVVVLGGQPQEEQVLADLLGQPQPSTSA
jgi:hypothetical protein